MINALTPSSTLLKPLLIEKAKDFEPIKRPKPIIETNKLEYINASVAKYEFLKKFVSAFSSQAF